MLFRSEFPSYPAASLPVLLLAAPFADESYHNDVCPSFVVTLDGGRPVRVFADFPDVGDREDSTLPRFRAYFDDADYGAPDVASDDIRDITEWLGARGVRFGAYVGGAR